MNLIELSNAIKAVLLPAIANRFDSSVLLKVASDYEKAPVDKYGNVTVLKDFDLDPKSMGNMSTFFKKVSLTITYGYSEDLLKLDENGEPVKEGHVIVRVPGIVAKFELRYETKDGGTNGVSERVNLYL